jgi:hypothetical protein
MPFSLLPAEANTIIAANADAMTAVTVSMPHDLSLIFFGVIVIQ